MTSWTESGFKPQVFSSISAKTGLAPVNNAEFTVEINVKDGTITREEAFYHPKKNMLIKALGCSEKADPDITVKEFLEGDVILMCSDGLTNMLKEDEIYNIIKEDEKEACNKLVEKANESGGLDNISVIVISNKD